VSPLGKVPSAELVTIWPLGVTSTSAALSATVPPPLAVTGIPWASLPEDPPRAVLAAAAFIAAKSRSV
jgi:hypothetical protein